MHVKNPFRDKSIKAYKNSLLKRIGWTLFIVECADKTYSVGFTRDLNKELAYINLFRRGRHFCNHPERVPVKVVWKETSVPWREAKAKYSYLVEMNRKLKKKLIYTKKWPYGGPWKKFKEENPDYFK